MAYADKQRGKQTGSWVGAVDDKRLGRKFKRHFESKKQAEAYEAYVRVMGTEPPALLEGRRVAPVGNSFREIATRCKLAGGPRGAWSKGKDPSTFQRLEFVVDRLGDYPITDITRALVRDKVAESLAKTGVKQSTINRYLSAASAVLQWAEDEEIIDTKPRLQFKDETSTREERHILERDHEERIIAHLEGSGRHVEAVCVRWLVESGMRVGELYKLRPEQIKHDYVELEKEQTKAGRPRQVYVRADLCREMRAIIASRRLPYPTQLLKTFQAAAEVTGGEKHLVLHGLRHTRATRLMQAKVRREIAMYILGHKDRDVHGGYLHVTLDDQRDAAAMVEKSDGFRGAQVVSLSDHTTTQPIEIIR